MKGDFSKLKELLLDEESRIVFDARIEYMETEDTLTFIRKMHNLYKSFQYPALDRFVEERNKKETMLVIFGAGYEGGIAAEILKHTRYASCIYGFCDNNRKLWGKRKLGLPIMSIYELLNGSKEVIFILSSVRYNYQFLSQLLNLGVSQKDIFIPQFGGYFPAQRGRQYFDVFEPCGHEVFVDAGAYDGMTSKDFLRWCNGRYDSIHMFELNADMESVCFANLEVRENISFTGKGVWNKRTFLKFFDSQNSAHVREISGNSNDDNLIEVCDIDSELKDKKVTFIKMDVEGSEMEALQGAQEIIRNRKPRLAVSVYHKLDDTVNIMNYLMKVNPDYRFYLRHYSACQFESVLYAV